MSLMDLSALSDSALAQEIRRRRQIHKEWLEMYRRDCIPFAHGMRLFGKIYNDLMKPEDPFQFMALFGRLRHGQCPEKSDAGGPVPS